ncbi:5403_t:CDS:2 [Ambispora leptoticha]|uniref:Ribosomal RNA-processing protein 40 n=1 Tax=Ambispora leptoticha TaxID=144679 RepID=A0A9N9AD08_9GLOM|nr:5403_t:CDS:2 [Ambispora leptoticha]
MQQHRPQVVLPGDSLPVYENKLKLGPGLIQDEDQIIAVKGGVLKHQLAGNKYWIESNQRRYVPATGDPVIGVITQKSGEFFRVDIGAAHSATLSHYAFENATKRYRPNHDVGTLLYCRVSLANKDMEPELECVNPANGRAGGFGELKDGQLVKCSLGLARRLLETETPILKHLAENFTFETAIGLNGRIWIKADTIKNTIRIINAIKDSEKYPESQSRRVVSNHLILSLPIMITWIRYSDQDKISDD